jgi:hypothetical protein
MNLSPPRVPHVFVGLIARHSVPISTHITLKRLAVEANKLGINVSESVENTGGIALARNLLCELFFDLAPSADWFLSFDDDVGNLSGADLARMISHEVDVIGAPLPGREISLESVVASLKNGELQRAIERPNLREQLTAIHESLSPLLVGFLEDGPRWIESKAGPLCEVKKTSAGCLLISRKAMAKMIERFGRFRFERGRNPPRLFNFTDEIPDDSYHFCEQWRSMGGKVYVDGRTRLSHQGAVQFMTKPLARLCGIEP